MAKSGSTITSAGWCRSGPIAMRNCNAPLSLARWCAPSRTPQGAAALHRLAWSPPSTPCAWVRRAHVMLSPSAMQLSSYDVAIVGGGPGGAATALALRAYAPSLSVVLLEASGYDTLRVGEALPPLARRLLEHLGVWESFCGQ